MIIMKKKEMLIYIPPSITVKTIALEEGIAAASSEVNPGGDDSDNPDIDDWEDPGLPPIEGGGDL